MERLVREMGEAEGRSLYTRRQAARTIGRGDSTVRGWIRDKHVAAPARRLKWAGPPVYVFDDDDIARLRLYAQKHAHKSRAQRKEEQS